MNCPVQLVLDGGEKTLGALRRDIIVNRRGVNVGDLLVELALGQPDFTDALQLGNGTSRCLNKRGRC